MLLATNLKLMFTAPAAGLPAPLAITNTLSGPPGEASASGERPALIMLAPGSRTYRVAGDFTRNGKPAEAPLATVRFSQPLAIMKQLVTVAEYQRCVDDG